MARTIWADFIYRHDEQVFVFKASIIDEALLWGWMKSNIPRTCFVG